MNNNFIKRKSRNEIYKAKKMLNIIKGKIKQLVIQGYIRKRLSKDEYIYSIETEYIIKKYMNKYLFYQDYIKLYENVIKTGIPLKYNIKLTLYKRYTLSKNLINIINRNILIN